MTGNTKRKTLILLGLVTLITMVIAADLPKLNLQPGMPIPSMQHGYLVAGRTEPGQFNSISISTFVLVLIALILTGTALYSIYQLSRGADWKLISDFLRVALIISAVISCIVFVILLIPGSSGSRPVEIPVATPQPVVTSPLGSAPPSLLWLVGIGLFVISAIVVIRIFTSRHPVHPMDLVGLEAKKAQQALQAGMDFKNVIMNCYVQMGLALKQEKGIERKDFMTTGEFESLLASGGIPHEPIHQLTRLFEAVRYGNWQPKPTDEQMAIQCLDAIVLHSREARRMN